jgi:hypothetical protein
MVLKVSKEAMDKAVAMLAVFKELVPEKVMEMQSAVARVYKNFIETYGNMTWEEVAVEIEKMATQKYDAISSFLENELKTMSRKPLH